MRRCSLADAFSQVPLYLRQTVTSVTTIPNDQPSAYTVGQQITLFSKVEPDVLVHESSHAQVICPLMCYTRECGSAAPHPWEAAHIGYIECASWAEVCKATLPRPCLQDGGFSSTATWKEVNKLQRCQHSERHVNGKSMLLSATESCRQSIWTHVYPTTMLEQMRWRIMRKSMWPGYTYKLQARYQDLEEAACSISLMPFQAARLQACSSSGLQPKTNTSTVSFAAHEHIVLARMQQYDYRMCGSISLHLSIRPSSSDPFPWRM